MPEIIVSQKIVTESEQVRNCPFCKSEKIDVYYDPGSHGYSEALSYVFCITCGARGPKTMSKKTAIRGWNGEM